MTRPVTHSAVRGQTAPKLPRAIEEAIDWMVLLDSGDASAADRRRVECWMKASPANAEAWKALSASLAPFCVASRAPLRRGALTERVLKSGVSRRHALGTVLGLAALGAIAATVSGRFVPISDLTADQITLTGERKTVALADGSSVVLGSRSAVDLAFGASERRLSLREGEAMLRTTVNQITPVVARTAEMTLHADGGIFVLRNQGRFASITTINAPATVLCADGQQVKLQRGQGVFSEGTQFVRRAAEIKTETAWVDGLLVVDNHSVGYVIARIRPYFPGIIRVSPEVAGKRVTGVFPLTDPLEALDMIGKSLDLTVSRITPYWVSLNPGTDAPV